MIHCHAKTICCFLLRILFLALCNEQNSLFLDILKEVNCVRALFKVKINKIFNALNQTELEYVVSSKTESKQVLTLFLTHPCPKIVFLSIRYLY